LCCSAACALNKGKRVENNKEMWMSPKFKRKAAEKEHPPCGHCERQSPLGVARIGIPHQGKRPPPPCREAERPGIARSCKPEKQEDRPVQQRR
jgi:hypothetical protein